MKIKPSTALRNEYGSISALAHETKEPIYITKNGEGDLVVMSIDAFENREKMLNHRAAILEAELARISGEPTYSISDVITQLQQIQQETEELYANDHDADITVLEATQNTNNPA